MHDIQSHVGSQESSIMSVYLHHSAAAATWPAPWISFQKERPEAAKELKASCGKHPAYQQ